jgi:hypothetical protein
VGSRSSVGASSFEDVGTLCNQAFESECPDRCREVVVLFNTALAKASLGAIRSPNAARAFACLLSLLRHPNEECRKAAIAGAAHDLDVVYVLKAAAQGLGGRDAARKWQATVNCLLAVRLTASKMEVLDGLRFRGLNFLVELWKTGGHVVDVAYECCVLALLLIPSHSRAIAQSGAAECALAAWQRHYRDVSRGGLTQVVAELTLACLPHLPERPVCLPQLTADSLRALMPVGHPLPVNVLLRMVARLGEEIKLGSELCSLGIPALALQALGDERYSVEVGLRRVAALAYTRPVLSLAESRLPAQTRNSVSAPVPLVIQPTQATGAVGSSAVPAHLPLGRPALLPSAALAAEAAIGKAPEPTIVGSCCASALKRRLETWRARMSLAGHAPASGTYSSITDFSSSDTDTELPPPLLLDADFESGSLGQYARLGAREYEVRLLPDVAGSGAHVQWFCFRVRGMQAKEPYTFHLTNLGKPGSLFDEGCQPVLFSRRRHALQGIGWTRAGSDIAYYPCDTGRRHCVSIEVVFPLGEDDEVFLAYSVPYTYSDLLADLERWKPASEIRRWAFTYSCAGQDIPAISFGNAEAAQSVCVIARAHPGETNASWVFRGFMDFLLSGAAEAEGCLQRLRWLVVPMLNPDGVASGRTRTNLEGVDLNRHHHDSAAPETRGLRTVLLEEVRSGPEPLAFIDIHAHSRRRGVFFITNGHDSDALVESLAARTPLLDAQGTSRPELRAQDEGVGRVAAARLGYKYSVTLESSLAARHPGAGGEHLSLEDLQCVGKALCLALLDVATLAEATPTSVCPTREIVSATGDELSEADDELEVLNESEAANVDKIEGEIGALQTEILRLEQVVEIENLQKEIAELEQVVAGNIQEP